MTNSRQTRPRPLSPNIQIYRPQLTSVLSIANRLTGIVLSLFAVALVAWLVAIAIGPQTFAAAQDLVRSWLGQIILLACTFCFFLHLCGGIRHLTWDAGYGFNLRSIYMSGWLVVAASLVFTLAVWTSGMLRAGAGR